MKDPRNHELSVRKENQYSHFNDMFPFVHSETN